MFQNWTEERILRILKDYFVQQKDPTIPRVAMRLWYWRDKERLARDKEFFEGPEYEADLLVITKTGFLKEIEIKTGIEDFRADFKKRHFHDHPEVRGISFCFPENVFNQHEKEIVAKCDLMGAGIVLITDEEKVIIKKRFLVRRYVEKLTDEAMMYYLKKAALKWATWATKGEAEKK